MEQTKGQKSSDICSTTKRVSLAFRGEVSFADRQMHVDTDIQPIGYM